MDRPRHPVVLRNGHMRAPDRKRFANTARRAYNGRVGSEPYEHTSKIMLTDNARTRIRLTSLSSCAG